MLIGRVIGTVVATRKDPNLVGLRFLLVEELDAGFRGTGKEVVAADAVGAGSGEVVLYSTGSSARLTEVTRDRPVDAVLIAIVDEVESGGEPRYRKSAEQPGQPTGQGSGRHPGEGSRRARS